MQPCWHLSLRSVCATWLRRGLRNNSKCRRSPYGNKHGTVRVEGRWCSSVSGVKRELSARSEAQAVADSKWAETPFSQQAFTVIGLKRFTEEELRDAFRRIDVNGNGVIEKEELEALCASMCAEPLADQIWEYEMQDIEVLPPVEGVDMPVGITEAQFIKRTRALATQVDPRVRPMALTFLASGAAIGVVIPVMPQLVKALGISSAEYGLIVGTFAATKLVGNIPAAALVDRFGRKPCLVSGIAIIGASIGGVGFCDTYQELMVCRGLTGIGVAAFTTAATMYLTDLSTPLNRAKTIAPAMAAFSAGAAIGPAFGGVLVDSIGFSGTFNSVGASYMLIAAANFMFVKEIERPVQPCVPSPQAGSAAPAAAQPSVETEASPKVSVFRQWRRLAKNKGVLNITLLNGGYWFVLSGSQMTILPLILVGDDFSFSASMVGSVFAGMSAIGVVMTPLAARLIDSVGQVQAIIPACVIVGGAMALAPTVSDPFGFLGLVAAWTTAGTVLSAAPTAFITDNVAESDRGQALALLRTGGDIGMLSGSVSSGIVAQLVSQPETIQFNGMALLGLTVFSGVRLYRRLGI